MAETTDPSVDESADDEVSAEDMAWLEERLTEYQELLAYLRDR